MHHVCIMGLDNTAEHNMTNTLDILTYIMGGRGSFTLANTSSGTHITYRVRRGQNCLFAYFLSGPDTYNYLGVLDTKGGKVDLRLTPKSQATWTANSTRGLVWLLEQCDKHRELPGTMKFQHNGQCCKCGRELTTPESIDRGIGPICATKI